MFKYIFQLIILSGFCSAQAFEVQNVTASQRTDGSHIIDVCYNISEDNLFVTFTTHAEISIDGGNSWEWLLINIIPNVFSPILIFENFFNSSNFKLSKSFKLLSCMVSFFKTLSIIFLE